MLFAICLHTQTKKTEKICKKNKNGQALVLKNANKTKHTEYKQWIHSLSTYGLLYGGGSGGGNLLRINFKMKFYHTPELYISYYIHTV